MTDFLTLSSELILAICEELDLNDLKQTRLTCKTIANDVVSLVLSHIHIPAKEATTIEEVVSDLQFLTKPERATVNCTREISIGVFSSIFPAECGEPNIDVKSISQDFLTALTSLQTVRTLNWYTGINDPPWLQETIWNAIGVLPNLRHFTINSFFLNHPLGNFDSLKALESIKISGKPFKHSGAIFLSLSKLYAASSSLSSISIENRPGGVVLPEDTEGGHHLQNMFSIPRGNPAHLLRSLALTGVLVHLDEITLSHLTNLTSLKLSSLPSGYDPKYVNNSPDDFWVAFRGSRICLEELEVGFEAMTDSLNDYLSSFSGLKKLALSIPPFESHASSEAFAVKFWSGGFPSHVNTLQDFSLYAHYGGTWCFGGSNCSLIASCTGLKKLAISIPDTDIPWDQDLRVNVKKHLLLDTVIAHMPHLNQLRLEVAFRQKYRGKRCGNLHITHRSHDEINLMELVSNYKPPASCQLLPQLDVNGGVFVGIKNAGCNQLTDNHLSKSTDE